MDIKRVENIYKQHRVSSLPPKKLILWMVEEAHKALEVGKEAMVRKDISEQNRHLQITQQLVLEIIPLVNSSNEMGRNLTAVLDFINRRLIEANMKSDVHIVEEIESLILDLKSLLTG